MDHMAFMDRTCTDSALHPYTLSHDSHMTHIILFLSITAKNLLQNSSLLLLAEHCLPHQHLGPVCLDVAKGMNPVPHVLGGLGKQVKRDELLGDGVEGLHSEAAVQVVFLRDAAENNLGDARYLG